MAGSTTPAGGATMLSAARDSVMLWATVKAVTTSSSRLVESAEQEQPDEKQQVVRTYQDMVNAGRHELPHDRDHALTRAAEVFELTAAAAENRLRRD